MNKKDRDRIARAVREGYQAYQAGKPITDNPYKVSDWGVGGSWNCGWWDGKNDKDRPRKDWEKMLSRMLLCQIGFDLSTFRKVAGEPVLNHLFNLYPDNPQTLLDDFDFTTEVWKPYYTPDDTFAVE